MTTSIELLRAAEHMAQRAVATAPDRVLSRAFFESAEMLESEAERLQAIEVQQPKRSWPEGWPPFAVLRRAYISMSMGHWPSTKQCERHGAASWAHREAAKLARQRWSDALQREGLR